MKEDFAETQVRGVILAAGASRRMGEPKGLLLLRGTPLLRCHVDGFRALGLEVTVVLGFAAARHLAVLPPGIRVEINLRWAHTDMAASAALALDGPVLLTPVDAPPALPETLLRLLSTPGDVVPTWGGVDGHPVRLSPPHPPGRLDRRLCTAARVAVDDPDCRLNLNTPEEWRAWARRGEPGSADQKHAVDNDAANEGPPPKDRTGARSHHG